MSYTPPQIDINGDSVRARVRYPATAKSDMVGGGAATNQAATVAILGDASTAAGNLITQVAWSYNAAGAGNLQIQGATAGVVLNLDVTAAGPGYLPFDPPLAFAAGEAVTVTLAAVAAITGRLHVVAWKMK